MHHRSSCQLNINLIIVFIITIRTCVHIAVTRYVSHGMLVAPLISFIRLFRYRPKLHDLVYAMSNSVITRCLTQSMSTSFYNFCCPNISLSPRSSLNWLAPVPTLLITTVITRSQHSQECKNPGWQCFCGSWSWRFDPKNKWDSRTHGGTFLCQVWWSYSKPEQVFLDIVMKNRQMLVKTLTPPPATTVGVSNNNRHDNNNNTDAETWM